MEFLIYGTWLIGSLVFFAYFIRSSNDTMNEMWIVLTASFCWPLLVWGFLLGKLYDLFVERPKKL